jgi:hypothetical protein
MAAAAKTICAAPVVTGCSIVLLHNRADGILTFPLNDTYRQFTRTFRAKAAMTQRLPGCGTALMESAPEVTASGRKLFKSVQAELIRNTEQRSGGPATWRLSLMSAFDT